MRPLAVEVDNLSKRFRRQTVHSATTLKTTLLDWLRGGHRQAEPGAFLALQNVSFSVVQGQALGITGSNGSGKSTLLKLLAGIYRPDAGTVRCHGRVGAILELGAGFHPEFSGRENVFISGIVMGLSKREVRDRFDSIVGFAELEDVIDDPVKTYSTGMYLRLGFAVAVHAEPDILLLDEVLAVGDARFRQKCLDKIAEFRDRGKTVVLVSHDSEMISRWADEAIWLEDGRLKDRGPSAQVVTRYLDEITGHNGSAESRGVQRLEVAAPGPRADDIVESGDGTLTIRAVHLTDARGIEEAAFSSSDRVRVEMRYQTQASVDSPVFGVAIVAMDGTMRYETSTRADAISMPPLQEQGVVVFVLEMLDFGVGTYRVDVASGASGRLGAYREAVATFSIEPRERADGVDRNLHHWEVVPDARSAMRVPT